MFWGLVLEAGKRYAQTVDKPFHISMASLDVMHSENELVSVNVNFQNAEFILCNLQKHKVFQTPLDLNFMAGDKIAFYTSGKGRVHLTGYLIDDDDDDLGIGGEDESDEEQTPNATPQKNAVHISKQEKRKSAGQTPGKPALKKSKMESEDEDEDEDEDDSDLEGLGESDEEMEVESGEEEEEEEEDEDEDDTDESEEMTPQKQPQGKNKEKQLSAQKQQQNKQPNTPNEMKKKKDKMPGAATPNTPGIQANGTPETQSGKKNKKKGGETPGDKGAQTPKPAQSGSPGQTPQKKILEGGVAVEDTVIGSGQVAKPGRFVTVYYTGRLKQNNKKFDETVQGSGFKFRLGKGEVIKGWDIGVTGMRVGGKRKLIIPPHMAYGAKGSPPVIPPNSALVFEVELRNVN